MPLLTCLFLSLAGSAPQEPGPDHYEAEIRPLLVQHCGECHGSDEPEAQLVLVTPGGVRAGSDSGPVLVPGDPDASRLIEAVRYGPDLQMPPKGRLANADIALLEAWVRAGAPMPEGEAAAAPVEAFDLEARLAHWSFQPIDNPAPPAVRDESWPRSDVDRFVLAALEDASLAPAGEASRRAWLRRVHYALNGLPPTRDEISAFLSDTRPDAYEHVVDALLVSPRYGVTWARHWLDLVRYCESKGHEFDYPIPNPWHYRDYVVRAFDKDVPYDRLLIEHLAGDLVEAPRLHPEQGFDESVLGTGSWWFGAEVHSPVDLRKDEADRVANQIDVFSKTFLGLTVACARCHDHKFDPISQADFYALSGFMLSSSYRQVRFDSERTNRRVQQQLATLREQHEPAVRARALELVRAELAAAPAALSRVAELLDEPLPEVEPPRDGDLLLEGFERSEWTPWRVEGDAFSERPFDAAGGPKPADQLRAIGQHLANSFSPHRTDKRRGRLIGPPFRVTRRFLHFRVGGGEMQGVGVQLWHADELVESARGERVHEMRQRVFDLEALAGEDVHIEIVDDTEEPWGWLVVDQFVLSDLEDPTQLSDEPWSPESAARQARLEAVAARHGLRPARLAAWTRWAEEAFVGDGGRASRPLERDTLAATFDPREATAGRLSDSPRFEILAAGSPRIRLMPGGGLHFESPGVVFEDSAWEGLRTTVGHMSDPSQRNWEQAGRTLILPTLTLEDGRLSYFVRGAVDVFAEIDSHRMLQGPLHGAGIKRIDTGGEWKLVQHDLSRYSGARVQLEFTPRDDGQAFGLAGVNDGPLRGRLPVSRRNPLAPLGLGARDWTAAWIEDSVAELASALELWSAGSGILEWPAGLLALALSEHEQGDADLAGPWRRAEEDLLGLARMESRTAPAVFDTPGFDEALLIRGQTSAPGKPVPRRNLEAFGAEAFATPGSGRLELARAWVRPDNPLVARVAANRIWHHLFERGLCPTVDDFGIMGQPPSHPELLDHLARRLVELKWSQKSLIRELVLSSTYRQSSERSAVAAVRDPDNVLLSHAPVRRLTAEALRDGLLYASGELVEERGGPSVPVHLTAFLEGRGRPGQSGPLDGGGRRSLYLAVRRNFLQPFLMAFDFPVPATTIGRRSRSNVPAQALTLLNDPFVAELCDRFAGRLLEAANARERLDTLYLRAFARTPSEQESSAALAFVEEQLKRYSGNEAERRVWADLVHVVFNTKEFLFLE